MFPFQTLDLCPPAKIQDTGMKRLGVGKMNVVRMERPRMENAPFQVNAPKTRVLFGHFQQRVTHGGKIRVQLLSQPSSH